MTQKFFVDSAGTYLGAFDGATPPEGATEVPVPPPDGWHRWTGSGWVPDYPADVLTAIVDELREQALQAISWDGHLVPTSGEPLLLLIGRATAYTAGVRTADSGWMMADGSVVTLTQAEFLAMAGAVDAGLEAAYGKSFAIKAQIAAGTLVTPAAVEAAWNAP